VPPWPVFEASETQILFGTVPINAPATRTFWVFNRGAIDDLVISSTTITPPAVANFYAINPTAYSVPAEDSIEVSVTFSPGAVGTNYNGLVRIQHNSNNTPTTYQMTVSGTGGEPDAVDNSMTGLPTEFALYQNYPNPFNPSTEVRFALPVNANVRLTVVNLLGQEVATAAAGFYVAGTHTVTFNASDLPAGLYFYRLDAADFAAVRKMMLLK
jgi:hypothetical protein